MKGLLHCSVPYRRKSELCCFVDMVRSNGRTFTQIMVGDHHGATVEVGVGDGSVKLVHTESVSSFTLLEIMFLIMFLMSYALA